MNNCNLKCCVSCNQSFSSLNNEKIKFNREFIDTCFLLSNSKKRDYKIVLKSINFFNFSTCIEASYNSIIKISKSNFLSNRFYSINLSDPKILKLKSCKFEKNEKTCLNIYFTNNDYYQCNNYRIISIKKSEFSDNLESNISIKSENLLYQNIKINILNNYIKNSFNENAIFLKNLNSLEVKIIQNEILNTGKNGIYLERITNSKNKNKSIIIQTNKISNCENSGLIIFDSETLIEDCEIFQNKNGGIKILGKEVENYENNFKLQKENHIANIINNCNLYKNKEFGIGIFGVLKGTINLINSTIYENFHGLYLNENKCPNSKKLKKNNLMEINIENNKIYQNESCGIFISSVNNRVNVKDTIIRENQEQAVVIVKEKEKFFICFNNAELGKIREKIQGFIGGPWGELFDDKGGFCNAGKCSIF